MSEAELTTLEKIHIAAKDAFMEYGFKSASLRQIVKTAGVTLGAFYGYYDSKEELFEALVGEQYEYIMRIYRKAQTDFTEIPEIEQPQHMGEISGGCMTEILMYAYDHLDEMKLILCRSEGTRFSGMIDEMVEIEAKATHDYQEVLKKLGRPSPEIDPRLEHILITGMFGAVMELIIHEMPLEQALIYLKEVNAFYTAGWKKIMGQ
ncbi:MAG: TetR/AcrR family transcriptional regulator [Ruminococcus sp.]|nr:TetR/AcrR family transcriptional regulator [Ruminococcus sp.]